jgi:transposase
VEGPTGQAVLACAAAFAGRPPTVRSLLARAPGRLTTATARRWVDRWRRLLSATHGQVLTTLPGVAVVWAAAFAAHSLPIGRFPTPEHLYAATGLAPAA